MTSFIHKNHLDFLSNAQNEKLNKHFMTASTRAMPHQLAVQLGIDYSTALAILADLEAKGVCEMKLPVLRMRQKPKERDLEAKGVCEMKLLIYHNCAPEVPMGAVPYGTGWPSLPWTCPNCESIVESYDELSFDLMAISKQSIEFV